MLRHAVDAAAAQLVGNRDYPSGHPHHNLPAGISSPHEGITNKATVLLPINQLGSLAHIKECAVFLSCVDHACFYVFFSVERDFPGIFLGTPIKV